VVSAEQARALLADGTIAGGMMPKVEACLQAIAGGVAPAHIISGEVAHALLVELFTEEGVGTMLVPDRSQ